MFFSFLKYLNGGIYMCFVDVCICALSMSVTLWTSLGVGSCPCTMTFWCCSIVLTCSYIFACFISSTLFPEPSFLSSIWSVLLVRISTEFLDMLRFSKIPIFYVCFPHFHACVCVLYMPMYIHVCIVCKWACTCVSMWESSPTTLAIFIEASSHPDPALTFVSLARQLLWGPPLCLPSRLEFQVAHHAHLAFT